MKNVSLTLLFCLALSSCGGYKETITQKSEKSFLKFTGTTAGASFTIDGGEMVTIDKGDFVYQVKPGRHEIKVYRANQAIVTRSVFVDSQATMEIEVP